MLILLVRFVEVRVWGTTSSRFDRPILGTLAPLAGLSQLQTLNLSGDDDVPMNFEGRILKLCGHNQRRFSFALRFCTGTLEPISSLVQLKELNVSYCRELTGTVLLYGNNQGAHPLADFQGHWLLWWGSAN